MGQAGVTSLPACRLDGPWLQGFSWLPPSSAPEFQGPSEARGKGFYLGPGRVVGWGQTVKGWGRAQAFPGDSVCAGGARRHRPAGADGACREPTSDRAGHIVELGSDRR